MRATGGQLVAVNATGCLEVFSTPYPETSWRIPWLHSLFANAPAVATGVAAALRVKGRTDVRVVGQAGDGGTVDIGMGCLSGMFERNDDVLFVCYDNEAYMNTGVQRSGATPPAARTATTEAVGPEPGNAFGQGKDMPRIAMAHEIPYVATATVADLFDLEAKVERAMAFHGARYLHVLVPCPLGLGRRPARHHPAGPPGPPDRAVPGLRGRARRGHRGVARSAGRCRSSEYLRLQKPLRPPLRRPTAAAARGGGPAPGHGRPQHRPLRAARRPRRGSDVMEKPVRHHPRRGLEPGQQDRLLAGRAARSTSTASTLQPRLPGRGGHPRWLYQAEEGDYEAAWRRIMEDNPLPAVMGRACFHPCETACNRAQLDEAVGINAVERFLGDRPSSEGWTLPTPAPTTGQRVLVVGSGPAGLSAAYHLRRRPRASVARPAAAPGGMLRYGIPAYRLPRDVVDAEIARIAGHWGSTSSRDQPGRPTWRRPWPTAASTPPSWPSAPSWRTTADIPAGDAARVLDAVSLLHGLDDGDARCSAAGWWSTAAATPPWTPPAPPAAWAPPTPWSSTGAPATACRPTTRRSPTPSTEGITVRGSPPSTGSTGGHLMVERMVPRRRRLPPPTGETEELEADSLVLALGQDPDLSLLDGLADVRVATAG